MFGREIPDGNSLSTPSSSLGGFGFGDGEGGDGFGVTSLFTLTEKMFLKGSKRVGSVITASYVSTSPTLQFCGRCTASVAIPFWRLGPTKSETSVFEVSPTRHNANSPQSEFRLK